MHWRWTTSRGQQLPGYVLFISEWRLRTSLLGPNLEPISLSTAVKTLGVGVWKCKEL